MLTREPGESGQSSPPRGAVSTSPRVFDAMGRWSATMLLGIAIACGSAAAPDQPSAATGAGPATAALIPIGVEESPQTEADTFPAPADTVLELRLGESLELPASVGRISFEAVLEDSRCPRGVQCVWAGNARLLFRVAEGEATVGDFELDTNPERGAGFAALPGLELRLMGLDPVPAVGDTAASRPYVARLSLRTILQL